MSILGGVGLRPHLFYLFSGLGVKNMGKHAHIILERSLRRNLLQYVIYLSCLLPRLEHLNRHSHHSLEATLYRVYVRVTQPRARARGYATRTGHRARG